MLIAEFARATGLSRDTIRFYVKKGLLQSVIGTNRCQDFDAEQVDRALLIREKQALGFTLGKISVLSKESSRGISPPSQ
jgi:MerR family transcriptional regulator, copper efflux regulator